MKIQTNKLTGDALDWAVAECEDGVRTKRWSHEFSDAVIRQVPPEYSNTWAFAGKIIEREKIRLSPTATGWIAESYSGDRQYLDDYRQPHREYGNSPLVAAMRCYVASKLGIDVDVPDK